MKEIPTGGIIKAEDIPIRTVGHAYYLTPEEQSKLFKLIAESQQSDTIPEIKFITKEDKQKLIKNITEVLQKP